MIKSSLKLLGLDKNKTINVEMVRASYRRLAKKVHPDAHTIPSLKLDSINKFINIKRAHDELIAHIELHGAIEITQNGQTKQSKDFFYAEEEYKKSESKVKVDIETFEETKLDKVFMKRPLSFVFFPSLIVTYFTVAILGLVLLGIPISIVYLLGQAKFGDDWTRISERYIITPLLFISPIIMYFLPILASLKKSGINWLQVYIWWAFITPTFIYWLCKQIESFLIMRKAKKTLVLD